MTLLELVERCEKATGPDRGIDADICRQFLPGELSDEIGQLPMPGMGRAATPALALCAAALRARAAIADHNRPTPVSTTPQEPGKR